MNNPPLHSLVNRHVLLGVTGGIAAYKSAELIRRLQDQGADVRVVMTRGATAFITPLTLQALSGHPVSTSLLDTESESAMGHIELARWADVILIAPATADSLARLCQGRGDDLLMAICLAAMCPIAVAPAMNQAMWQNPITRQNCQLLAERGIHLFGPGEGEQACGEVGPGRLMEVDQIVNATAAVFNTGELAGQHVLLTAGPTREALDPVRYISNHSSGKQGYALAEAARDMGARVTLISGPVTLQPPTGIETVNVISADEMHTAVMSRIEDCDVFIAVAAVADYKPVRRADQKIKKSDDETLALSLVKNPDILAAAAAMEDGPFTVGFAAETEQLLQHARRKLQRKGVDMIVANDVSDRAIGFHSEENKVLVLERDSDTVLELDKMSKSNLSRVLLQIISKKLVKNTHR